MKRSQRRASPSSRARWKRGAAVIVAASAFGACSEPNQERGSASLVPECDVVADGRLSADELPLATGVSAFWVQGAVTAAAAQAYSPDRAVWDFRAGPEESGAPMTIVDVVETAWSGGDPGEGSFAQPAFVDLPDLFAVQRLAPGADSLQLHGFAVGREVSDDQRFDLRYAAAVPVLQLPLQPEATWAADAQFRAAVLAGVPNQGVERWSFDVVGSGRATLPGDVEVVEVLVLETRVEQRLALSVGGSRTVARRSFFAPCLGEFAFLVDGGGGENPTLGRLIP